MRGPPPRAARRPGRARSSPAGESTAIGKLMETYGFYEPIRERHAQGMAVWGTCAGADPGRRTRCSTRYRRSALARLMDMTVRRNAFGRQVDSLRGRSRHRGSGRRATTAACSSGRRGSRRSGRTSRYSPITMGIVVAREPGRALPPRSIRNSPATRACTATSSKRSSAQRSRSARTQGREGGCPDTPSGRPPSIARPPRTRSARRSSRSSLG